MLLFLHRGLPNPAMRGRDLSCDSGILMTSTPEFDQQHVSALFQEVSFQFSARSSVRTPRRQREWFPHCRPIRNALPQALPNSDFFMLSKDSCRVGCAHHCERRANDNDRPRLHSYASGYLFGLHIGGGHSPPYKNRSTADLSAVSIAGMTLVTRLVHLVHRVRETS